MTSYSNLLRLTLQDVGENPDVWGTVLNTGVFEMLEDAISGMATFSVTSGDVTLTTVNGATDQARCMILVVTGAPGVARNIIVPNLTKTYFVNNTTTGGFTITIKTAAGSGFALPANKPTWVYCDGTNVLGSNHAATADSATNVTTTVGGIAIAQYGRRDFPASWQKGQSSEIEILTDAATVAIDLFESNKFRLVTTDAVGATRVLGNPTNPLSGQSFEVQVVQSATGSRALTYGSKYRWPGGVTPTLTTTPNRADLLVFSYDIGSDKYLGSIIQNYTLT